MERININLLPEEFLAEKRLGSKKALFLRFSIIACVTALILTSIVLLIRLNQSQTIASLEGELEATKNNVTALKDNESAVFVLKNRLDKINQISGKESIPVQAYNLLTSILPAGSTVTSFSMSKDDIVSLSVDTPDTQTLDQLFTSLLDPEINQGYIKSVKLENIRLTATRISTDMALGYNPKGAPQN